MTLLSSVCEWVGRKSNTIVMIPHPFTVGNCSEHILYGLLRARREGKKLVLLYQFPLPWPMHYRLTNQDMINVDSDFRAFSTDHPLYVIGSLLVTVYAGFCRLIHPWLRRLGHPLGDESFYPMVNHWTLWQPKDVMPDFSWDIVAQYKWPRELHTKFPVHLSDQKKAAGVRELRQMGLPAGAWFVCLHVRESGWHKDSMTERNANVMNYIEAIREVTTRGGWIIRLGDPSMTKLPTMEQVIDYPFTSSKSYAMDLFLISECRAYIGMPTGIYDVAVLFQRPMVLTNMASWLFPMPHKFGDVGVLKQIYSKSRRRFLSVREWMFESINATSFRELGEDYVLHENSSEELRAAVREFFDRKGNGEPTLLQREFNTLRVSQGHNLLSKPIRPQDGIRDQRQRYRIASRLESAFGLISDDYLQKYWARDVREQS